MIQYVAAAALRCSLESSPEGEKREEEEEEEEEEEDTAVSRAQLAS